MDSLEEHDEQMLQRLWIEKAFKSGLFRASEKATTSRNSSEAIGVSLSFLEAFARSFETLLSDEDADAVSLGSSTASLMHKLVLPAMYKKTSSKTKLLDFVPSGCQGPPQYFVSHAWGAPLSEMVLAVQLELAPTPGPADPPLPIGFKDEIFVALDLFTNNLYTNNQTQNTLSAATFETMDPDTHSLIASCSKGLLLVIDNGLLPLSRTWILYELFLATYRSSRSHTFITVAFPGLPSLARIFKMKELFLEIDINRAETTFPSHKVHILQQIRKRCGVQRTNGVLINLLVIGLHNKLRWRGGLWGKGTLAAIYAQEPNGAKLRLLRLLLSSIESLSDDESQLRFMRELFVSYDTDGSGELDEEEFVSVLVQAGWDPSAALGAYYSVNTNGQGGVDIAEFENWWKRQAKDDSSDTEKAQSKVEMTRAALKINIERMPGLLERNGLTELAQVFKAINEKIDDAWLSRAMPPILLDAEVTRGLEQIAANVSTKDYKAGAAVAYDLLYSNALLLDADVSTLTLPETRYATPEKVQVQPPSQGRESTCGSVHAAASAVAHMEMTYHPSLLASYMEILARLLRYIPALGDELDFLLDSLVEIKAELEEGDDEQLKRSLNAKGSMSMASRDKNIGGSKSIMGSKMALRETLRAKFGNKEIITQGKIKDFQVALSQFVAATKGLSSKMSGTAGPDLAVKGKSQAVAAATQAALKQSQKKAEELKLPSLADLRIRQTIEQREQRHAALEDEYGPGSERPRSFSSLSMTSPVDRPRSFSPMPMHTNTRTPTSRGTSFNGSRAGGDALVSPKPRPSAPSPSPFSRSTGGGAPLSPSRSPSQLIDEVFGGRTEDDKGFLDSGDKLLESPCSSPLPGGGSWRSGKSVTRFSVAFLPDAPPIESLIKRAPSAYVEELLPVRKNSQTLARLAVFRETSGNGEVDEDEGNERLLPEIGKSPSAKRLPKNVSLSGPEQIASGTSSEQGAKSQKSPGKSKSLASMAGKAQGLFESLGIKH